jgi:hypothetical protein
MHPGAWPEAGTNRAKAEALVRDLGRVAVPFSRSADPYTDHCIVHLAPSEQ